MDELLRNLLIIINGTQRTGIEAEMAGFLKPTNGWFDVAGMRPQPILGQRNLIFRNAIMLRKLHIVSCLRFGCREGKQPFWMLDKIDFQSSTAQGSS
jgi:hypothetical protein